MNTDENKKQKELEGKEAEVLRVCFEKPSSADEISATLTMSDVEVGKLIDGLKERDLIVEEEGKYKPTKEGDYYLSE